VRLRLARGLAALVVTPTSMGADMRSYPYFRARQIMPPGEFDMALWQVEDGTLKVYREPLVGWALGDDWSCTQADCSGKSCIDVESHELPTREVRPMFVVDDLVWVEDDPGPNTFIIPKSLNDDDLLKRAQELQRQHDEMAQRRREREAAERAASNGDR
jgi:hypothetical protein